jgi:hypothetical protein
MSHVAAPQFIGGPLDGDRAPVNTKGYDAFDVQVAGGIARYTASWTGDYQYVGTRSRGDTSPETLDEENPNG